MIFIKRFKIFSLLLFPVALIINFIGSKYPEFIDKYYSSFINKFMIQILSKISCIFPFSLYEFFMYLIIFYMLLFLIYIIIILFKNISFFKNIYKNSHLLYNHLYKNNDISLISILKCSLLNVLSILSIAYFLFIVLWGLNYNRLPLETTLINNYKNILSLDNNLSSCDLNLNNITNHNVDDLSNLYKFLINKANKSRELTLEDNNSNK